LIAILIVVVVLKGAAAIIEDMDHPPPYNSPTSLIVVNLDPLRHLIEKKQNLKNLKKQFFVLI